MEPKLTPADYEALAELRYQIRRFLHFSEQASQQAGLEPRQHQLMLTLKGLPGGIRPTIGELAERLQIRHNSAVELANRLAAGGYVRRRRGGKNEDRREVLLSLTPKGERILRDLSLNHKAELRMRGPALVAALKRTMQSGTTGKRGCDNNIASQQEKNHECRKAKLTGAPAQPCWEPRERGLQRPGSRSLRNSAWC